MKQPSYKRCEMQPKSAVKGGEPKVSPASGRLVVMPSGFGYLPRRVANLEADRVDWAKEKSLSKLSSLTVTISSPPLCDLAYEDEGSEEASSWSALLGTASSESKIFITPMSATMMA